MRDTFVSTHDHVLLSLDEVLCATVISPVSRSTAVTIKTWLVSRSVSESWVSSLSGNCCSDLLTAKMSQGSMDCAIRASMISFADLFFTPPLSPFIHPFVGSFTHMSSSSTLESA